MADRDLTQGPVARALASVSAPMSLGILAVLSVGLADAYFLGMLGPAPLAAVGFIYPVTITITSLAIGLSAGANSSISQAIGRKDDDAPTRLALHALILGGALSVLVALAFFALASPLFALMGAGDAALREAEAFVPFWALSFPFLVVTMIANAAFRAHGDGATAAVIMILSAAVNIALNPLLIFGFGPIEGLGTEGAALATFIGRLAGAAIGLGYAYRVGVLTPCAAPLKGLWASFRSVLSVGLPASFSNAVNPAGMAIVTAAVATLGDAAVAGFGAATRIQSVAIVVLMALSAGVGPVVGQNWGADRKDRARQALGLSWQVCVIYGLAVAGLLTLLAEPIAGLFTEDTEVRDATALYLVVVSWSFFGYGMIVTTNAAMNARGKALYSMGLSLARILAIYVPFAWIGVTLFGLPGILAAAVAANLFAAAGSVLCARATGLLPRRVARTVPEVLPQVGRG